MRAAGLDVIPGSDGVLAARPTTRARSPREVGFPVLFKAENGGGGRGMRIARGADEVEHRVRRGAGRGARGVRRRPRVYLEKLVEGGRHVEIQIFADRYGHAVHLGERDCTVQRNHQKLIEESPSPAISADLRARDLRGRRARRRRGRLRRRRHDGAAARPSGVLRFMEMNCRLQVEHTVSEERTGKDLVIAQIEIAAGRPLAWRQDDIALTGHVIECRINAEDPAHGFQPAPGHDHRVAAADRRRHPRRHATSSAGYVVPPFYDSLLAKVIVHGRRPRRGDRRDDRRAVGVRGRRRADDDPDAPRDPRQRRRSATGRYDTRAIPGWPPASCHVLSTRASTVVTLRVYGTSVCLPASHAPAGRRAAGGVEAAG